MISNLNINKWQTFIETSTITPEITIDTKNEIENDTKATNYETSITQIPMTIFNITMRSSQINAKSHLNRTINNYTYLILDEVSYMKMNESIAYDSSTITSNIDDGNISLNDLLYDENEIYNDLYSDDSFSSTNDRIMPAKFTSESLSLHQIQSQPEMETTSILNTINNQFKNANKHQNSLISIDNSSVLYDTEESKEEFDHTISANPENNKVESTTRTTTTTISQIIDPIKSDITIHTLDDNLNDRIVIDVINGIATTSIPEIEEIADINMNHKKIIHQTLTVLKTENPINDDSSLSVTSTIPSASTSISFEQAMIKLLSSNPNFLHKLNDASTTTITSDTDKELISITDKNNNIFNAIAPQSSPLSTIAKTESSFFQQKFITGRNGINIPFLPDESNTEDLTFIIDHTVPNIISSSVTSVQHNLIRNSFANDEENLQSTSEISTINKFLPDESNTEDLTFIIDHTVPNIISSSVTSVQHNLIRNSFANDEENLQSTSEISTINKFLPDESITDDFNTDENSRPSGISTNNNFSPDWSLTDYPTNSENSRPSGISTNNNFSPDWSLTDYPTNSENSRQSGISTNNNFSPDWSLTDYPTNSENSRQSGISTNNNFSLNGSVTNDLTIEESSQLSVETSTNNNFSFDKKTDNR
uniref:Uncharacterized protein n=1 Tax=Wuchereria bancrofti TaxID=6293 RepID=A0AAF5RUB0_WUCBA